MVASAKTRLKKMFKQFHQSFRYAEDLEFTLDCEDVCDVENGSFWNDCTVVPARLSENRKIIDEWSRYERAKEECSFLKRDVELLRKHTMDDIVMYRNPIFPNSIPENEENVLRCMLNKKIAALEMRIVDIDNKLEFYNYLID